MRGRSPFETWKRDLVPGGHAECPCVFSDHCLWLESRRASTAPLEDPGNPVAGSWADVFSPKLILPTHLLTLDTGHPGCPVATHSEWGSHLSLLQSTERTKDPRPSAGPHNTLYFVSVSWPRLGVRTSIGQGWLGTGFNQG